MGFGGSSLPVILSKGTEARRMLYSSVGMRTYGQTVTTWKLVHKRDAKFGKYIT